MTDLAVIILTKDEKLHIKRCLERLAPLEPRQIFIVDCFSTDGTQEIVKRCSKNFHPLNLSTPPPSQTFKLSNLPCRAPMARVVRQAV
ncbi:MAG: glycosyltransferase [Kiritimatiellae bacterium]|nr:glycosyltransferase [Kiritimatiellia bacterium]